uniref:Uncharacterized protein n=1 Tax=uncultured marine group II/III euryarchaeote KM3_180_D08 TaxID=1457942 RepID=A0A075GQ54_9EURY|nr:hypothetical protein [uncultured marine group II/III euryarchaeote KM3_180_D08]
MTTQNITAYAIGPAGSKIFTVTATDGSWDNPMTDSIGSNDLGQTMAGATLTNLSVVYTAGNCFARIQDRNTLQVFRTITGAKVGATDFSQTKITPYVVKPNDILVCYPQPMEATANQSNCLAWLQMSKGIVAFGGTDIPDSTSTEITSLVNNQSLGTYDSQNLTGLKIQVEDGAKLNAITVIDPNGGTILTLPATTRDAGHYYYNLEAEGFSIPVLKGMTLKVDVLTS